MSVEKDGHERLFFVAETKRSLFTNDLRGTEGAKIACGKAHFRALEVREASAEYVVARTVDDLMAELRMRFTNFVHSRNVEESG